MKEKIEEIKNLAKESIKTAEDLKVLDEIRVKYLGKKGELTAILRGMGSLSAEERPIVGSMVNEAKDDLEKIIKDKEELLKAQELEKKLEKEKIDITLPSDKIRRGSKHPINRVIEELEDLFVSMGYDVVDGP